MPSRKLNVSKQEAEDHLNDRIEIGVEIIERNISNSNELEKSKSDFRKWTSFNKELLGSMFEDNSIIEEYNEVTLGVFGHYREPLTRKIERHKELVKKKIEALESIKERLVLFESIDVSDEPEEEREEQIDNNKVFIIHGHNNEVKETVARTIERLGLEAIILNEMPNNGQTIIEKLENNSDVGFAVVLLTPDDLGKANYEEEYNHRARQNVLVEMGYFIAKLGREKICPIQLEEVEVPSDFDGIVYVKYDEGGRWKFILGRELKAAGYNVDLNDIA